MAQVERHQNFRELASWFKAITSSRTTEDQHRNRRLSSRK